MHNIFYFTDVHGQLDLFQTMRDWCYKQDPECTIVFGGDACDRGQFGYDIMEMILDDPQMVYIRGNHEDMFIRAARELLANNPEIKNQHLTIEKANYLIDHESWLHHVKLCLMNGGRPTLRTWLIEGTNEEFIDKLDRMTCYTFELDNGIQFSHAGGPADAWKRVNNAEYYIDQDKRYADVDDIEDVIWDRDYLYDWWPVNKIIVFGHTPTVYLNSAVYGKDKSQDNIHPCAYKGDPNGKTGWHIAMDTGMTWSGRGYILNCLTMEVIGFWDIDVNKMENKAPIVQEFAKYKII